MNGTHSSGETDRAAGGLPSLAERRPTPREPKAEATRLHCAGEVRVLILDDDDAICRLIQAALARTDFHVDAVHDPVLMEAQVRSQTYHVVILDYVIPG